jgi:hypothetical protein
MPPAIKMRVQSFARDRVHPGDVGSCGKRQGLENGPVLQCLALPLLHPVRPCDVARRVPYCIFLVLHKKDCHRKQVAPVHMRLIRNVFLRFVQNVRDIPLVSRDERSIGGFSRVSYPGPVAPWRQWWHWSLACFCHLPHRDCRLER